MSVSFLSGPVRPFLYSISADRHMPHGYTIKVCHSEKVAKEKGP